MENRESGGPYQAQVIPLHRPHYSRSKNAAVVVSRRSRSTSNLPRPHSIGASIISNPKLVKGWQYYDNSPNQRSVQKYLSTINLPYDDDDSSEGGTGSDGDANNSSIYGNSSPYRDSYRRGVGVMGDGDDDGDDYVPGVEVQACVATDCDFTSDDDDDEDDAGSKSSGCGQYFGIILTLLASSALAMSAVLVKMLPVDEYHPYSVSVWTFQGILLPSLVVFLFSLCRCKVRRKEDDLIFSSNVDKTTSCKKKFGMSGLVLIRALFGWLGVVLKVYSLRFMSVIDSTIITFSSPVFVGIAAWCYLKEKMGLVPVLTAVLVLVGVGVITRPKMLSGEDFNKDQLIGTGMAVGCMLLGVFSVIILRYIRNVHYALVTFIYGLMGTAGSLLLSFFVTNEGFQFPKDGRDWAIAGSIAGLTFIGQNLMTVALKYEQAVIFAVVRTWEIPITFLWEFIFLKKAPDSLSLIGAALVVFGVLVITVRKWIQTMPKSRNIRRWLRFLLW